MKLARLFIGIASAGITLLLGGCVAPEDGNIKLAFSQTGAYNVKADVKIVYVPYVAALRAGNKATVDTEESMHKFARVLVAEKMAQSAKYLGEGRLQMNLDEDHAAGAKSDPFGILVQSPSEGYYTVTSQQISPKDWKAATDLGMKPKGELEIVLPKNAEVIETNADSKPLMGGVLGMFNSYKWKASGPRPGVVMRFKIKKA